MNKKNVGFTLVEVLLALALLGIITIFLIPVFTFMIRSSTHEQQKFVAHQLASSQLEWIKTIEYEKIGLNKAHYQPKGIIEEDLFMNELHTNPYVAENNSYRVHTKISWQKEKSHTGEIVGTAVKIAEVSIYVYNPFLKKEKIITSLSTAIAFEGERTPKNLAYIEVYTLGSNDDPKKNVNVDLRGPMISTTYSDQKGRALFGEVLDGNYEVDIISWDEGPLMVKPLDVRGSFPNQRYISSQKTKIQWKKEETEYPPLKFYLDWPTKFALPSSRLYPEDSILEIQPTKESLPFPEGAPEDFMKLSIQLKDINSTSFWWQWKYDYKLINQDEEFFIFLKDEKEEWDGYFVAPQKGGTLYPINLYVGVINKGNFYEELVNKEGEAKTLKVIEIDFTSYLTGWENTHFKINEKLLDQKYTLHTDYEALKQAMFTEETSAEFGYFIEKLVPESMDYHKKVKIYLYDPQDHFPFYNEMDQKIEIENPEVLKNRYYMTVRPDKNTVILEPK